MNNVHSTKSRLHTLADYDFTPLKNFMVNNDLQRPTYFPNLRLSLQPGRFVRVKTTYNKYFGCISMQGRFCPSPAVNEDFIRADKEKYWAALLEANDNPEFALLEHGKLTGICGICGRALTDPASIEAGIGPICAGKIGLGG